MSPASPKPPDGMASARARYALLCRIAASLLLTAFVAFGAAGAAAGDSPAAERFVRDVGQQVLAIRQADRGGPEEIRQLKAIIRANLHLDLIGRFALGRHYETATSDQRKEYQQLLTEWMTTTYANWMSEGKFDIEIVGSKSISSLDDIVWTVIRRDIWPDVTIGWRVREAEGKMKVIDIIVNGTSRAASYRDEFGSAIRRQGLGGFLNALRRQVAAIAVEASAR